MTQRWLPSAAGAMRHPEIFCRHDMEGCSSEDDGNAKNY